MNPKDTNLNWAEVGLSKPLILSKYLILDNLILSNCSLSSSETSLFCNNWSINSKSLPLFKIYLLKKPYSKFSAFSLLANKLLSLPLDLKVNTFFTKDSIWETAFFLFSPAITLLPVNLFVNIVPKELDSTTLMLLKASTINWIISKFFFLAIIPEAKLADFNKVRPKSDLDSFIAFWICKSFKISNILAEYLVIGWLFKSLNCFPVNLNALINSAFTSESDILEILALLVPYKNKASFFKSVGIVSKNKTSLNFLSWLSKYCLNWISFNFISLLIVLFPTFKDASFTDNVLLA